MSLHRSILSQSYSTHHCHYDEVSPDDIEDCDGNGASLHLCPRLMPDDKKGCALVWRILTIILCLPLCYPCYITKKTREYWRSKESTPKKLVRGRCSHHHHDTLDRDRASSLTPTLRSQRSISSQKSISSLKNFQEDVEKLNVIFLISRTGNKLVDSLDLYPSPEKMEDCIGSKVITSNDVNFNVMYHQELSSLKSNQSHTIGSMNMVVMVYSDMAELQEIVNNEVGIISHIRKYWRGYLPLMLIQVGCPNEAIKESCLDILERDYSSCFCLHVNDPCSIDEILVDRCIKYFLHNEKFLCHKVDKTTSTSVNQSLHEPSWKCSGLCGLKSSERDSLRKKKRSVINAIRRKISRHDTII